MAETSLLWTGTTLGDASSAPYDHLEFTRMFNKILASDGAGYVIPGYANSLNVQASSPAAASVDVATGAAYIKGFLYETGALVTLPIAANASGNPRIDRVVLRVDFGAQTVRLAVLQGVAAAAPAIPALTTTYGGTWEISLGYVWVANGFATIGDSDIHDERDMLHTASSLAQHQTRKNLIRGSEFIPKWYQHPGANRGTVGGTWYTPNVAGEAVTFAARPSQQTRGNTAIVTATAQTFLAQHVVVKPSTTYTLRSLIKVITSGDLVVDVYGYGSAASLISKTLRIANTVVDEVMRFTTGATDTEILIRFTVAANKTMHIAQSVLLEGYHKGNYDPVHELIQFDWGPTAGGAGVSSTSVVVDLLGAGFAGLTISAPDDVVALVMQVDALDSGSAAGAAVLRVYPPHVFAGPASRAAITLVLDGTTNSKQRFASGVVGATLVNDVPNITTFGNIKCGFAYQIVATGANTFSWDISISGMFV